MAELTLSDLEAQLRDSSSDSDDLPSWTDEPKKKKKTVTAPASSGKKKPTVATVLVEPPPLVAVLERLSQKKEPPLCTPVPSYSSPAGSSPTPSVTSRLKSPGLAAPSFSPKPSGIVAPFSSSAVSKISGIATPTPVSKTSFLSTNLSPGSTTTQRKVYAKPTAYDLELSGRDEKSLQELYDAYQLEGLSIQQWKSLIADLDVKLGPEEAEDAFLKAHGGLKRGEFSGFCQAMAVVAMKKLNGKDPANAIKELMEGLSQKGDASNPLAEEAAEETKEADIKLAILRAKERLAEAKKKQQERLAEEHAHELAQAKSETAVDEAAAELEERRRIAANKRFMAAKAKLAAEKRQEEKQFKLAEVADDSMHSLEERGLAMARLRAEARTKAVERSREEVRRKRDDVQMFLKEAAALEEEKEEKKEQSPEEKIAALKKIQERMRKSKVEREQAEKKQQEEEERERIRLAEVNERRNQMSKEGLERANARAKAFIKLKLQQQEEERRQIIEEANRRADENAQKVALGSARAAERTEVHIDKLELDDELKSDVEKMWKPFIVAGRLHKANWPVLLAKYKLVDGINLKNSQLDALFSKNSVKGEKGLDLKHFAKAIAQLGLVRFPEKNNTSLNSALLRVLYHTVRKHDPEEYEKRKRELEEQRKEFYDAQARIEQAEQRSAEKKQQEVARKTAAEQESRKKRLEEQLARLAEEEAEHAENQRKAAAAAALKVEREVKCIKEAAAERIKKLEEHKLELEEERKRQEEKHRAHVLAAQKKEEREKKAKEEEAAAKKARDDAAAVEGMKKAALRLSERKKEKDEIELNDEEIENIRVVFKHYCLNKVTMTRSDWLHCVVSFGFQRKKLVKSDLEQCFEQAMENEERQFGLHFENFLKALLILACKLYPELDTGSTETMRKLLNAIFGEEEEENEIQDQPVGETMEERAARLAQYQERSKQAKAEKLRREAEDIAQQELEIEQAEIKARKDKERAAVARKRAAERLAKKKQEEFTISRANKDHLDTLFNHFKLRSTGLSRSDWLNCVSTILDYDDVVTKSECSSIFEEVLELGQHGLNFNAFCIAMSYLGQLKYPQCTTQTSALEYLINSLEL